MLLFTHPCTGCLPATPASIIPLLISIILLKEPETLIKLAEGGVEIPKVDLGIMFNEDGRTPVTRFIALDEKEKADLATIKGMGIPVVIQYVPTDAEEVYEG